MKFSCFLFKMNFGKYFSNEVLTHLMIFICLLASINLNIIASEKNVSELPDQMKPEKYFGAGVLPPASDEKKAEQLQEWEDEKAPDLPQPEVENKNEERVKEVIEEREQPENYSDVRVLKPSLADEKRIEKILNKYQLQEWEDDEFGPDLPQSEVEDKNEKKVKGVMEKREQSVLNTVIRRINRNFQLETNANVLLYNANIPVESIEIREGNGTVRKGVPRSKKQVLWDIPINIKSGPFLLSIIAGEKSYPKLYLWKIANFNLGKLELGLIEKKYSFGKREIILIQIHESPRGFITSKIIAPLK